MQRFWPVFHFSWRGALTQYAERLHRQNAAKKEVVTYDYVNFDVSMLARMFAKQRKGYHAMGSDIILPEGEIAPNNQMRQLRLTGL